MGVFRLDFSASYRYFPICSAPPRRLAILTIGVLIFVGYHGRLIGVDLGLGGGESVLYVLLPYMDIFSTIPHLFHHHVPRK